MTTVKMLAIFVIVGLLQGSVAAYNYGKDRIVLLDYLISYLMV